MNFKKRQNGQQYKKNYKFEQEKAKTECLVFNSMVYSFHTVTAKNKESFFRCLNVFQGAECDSVIQHTNFFWLSSYK